MAEADRTTPKTIKKKIRKKQPAAPAYKLPSNFRTESAGDKPRQQKAGPVKPQQTGARSKRKQPILRKPNAPSSVTDTTSDAKRSPAQRAHDKAVSDANIRAARRAVLRRRGRGAGARLAVNALKLGAQSGAHTGLTSSGSRLPGATTEFADKATPFGAEVSRAMRKQSRPGDEKAPALKALEISSRPLKAVMSNAKEDVKQIKAGKVPTAHPKAVIRALEGKTNDFGSDVLKEAGVKNKVVRSVGGFILDTVADPVRTGKLSRLAPRTALERAARETESKAAKAASGGRIKPARPKKAAKLTARAQKLRTKAATASESPGIQVGIHGPHHRIMSSGRASSAVGRKLKPISDRLSESRVAEAAKGALSPTARHAGETAAERDAFVYAERKRRARKNEAKRKAQRRGTAHAKGVRGVDEPQMVAAVEGAAKKPLTDTMRTVRVHPAHKTVSVLKQRVSTLKLKQARTRGRVEALVASKAPHGAIQKAVVQQKRIEADLATARSDLKVAQAAARGVSRQVETLAAVAGTRVDSRGRVTRVAGQSYADFKNKAEAHKVGDLPPRAQAVARATEKELGQHKAAQQQSQIFEGERSPYYPHRLVPQAGGVKIRRPGGRKPSHAKRRKDERPIAEQHAERAAKGKGPIFSTDHPTVMANYIERSGNAQAEARHLMDVKAIGKPLTARNWAKARSTDGLYRITPTSIQKVEQAGGRPLDDGEVRALIAKGEDITILPVSRADEIVRGRVGGKSEQTAAALRILNKPMQVFKTSATVLNVGYYQLRNFMDDSWHSYAAGTRVARTFPKATALVKDLSLLERREGRQLDPKQIRGRINVAGKGMSKSTLVQWMVEDGAARTGFHAGSDLREGSMRPATGIRRVRPVQKIREWSQNAEDVPRVATYLDALDRGATRQEAAAHMRIYHFDYDELTDIERVIRATLVPFYTYAKKNTALMIRLFVTRPGRLSRIEALRQEFNKYGTDDSRYRDQIDKIRPQLEAAKKAGLITQAEIDALYRGEFAGLLTDTDQRSLPFLGPDGSLQYMPLGVTDLSRIPFATSWGALRQLPGRQLDLALQMVGPQKLPLELHQNYSFFFRDAIYRDAKNTQADRWVTAPPWAKKVGIPTRRMMQDGKMVDMWPAKLDYTVRSLGPQAGNLATVGNPAKTSRGVSWQDALLKQVTGVRRASFDDRLLAGVISRAAQRLGQINVALADLGDNPQDKIDPQGRYPGGGFASKQYKALADEQKALGDLIANLKTARTGVKPSAPLRVEARPKPYDQQIQDRVNKALGKYQNYDQYLKRKYGREAAKQRILSSGG